MPALTVIIAEAVQPPPPLLKVKMLICVPRATIAPAALWNLNLVQREPSLRLADSPPLTSAPIVPRVCVHVIFQALRTSLCLSLHLSLSLALSLPRYLSLFILHISSFISSSSSPSTSSSFSTFISSSYSMLHYVSSSSSTSHISYHPLPLFPFSLS